LLQNDKIDKAVNILGKTKEMYEKSLVDKTIPNLVFTNLYCNYGKALCVQKKLEEAEPLYKYCILNHPVYKMLLRKKDILKENFLIEIDKILEENLDDNDKQELVINKTKILLENFTIGKENSFDLIKSYKANNLNNLNSFTDSLVNLAVIFQHKNKGKSTNFNMYYLAVLCDQNNSTANTDLNNFLREVCNYMFLYVYLYGLY